MQQLIKANEMASYGANSDSINFSEMMNMMCVNNYKSSKKMGKGGSGKAGSKGMSSGKGGSGKGGSSVRKSFL